MVVLEALNGPQDSVKLMVKAFDERRRFMHKRLNERKREGDGQDGKMG